MRFIIVVLVIFDVIIVVFFIGRVSRVFKVLFFFLVVIVLVDIWVVIVIIRNIMSGRLVDWEVRMDEMSEGEMFIILL